MIEVLVRRESWPIRGSFRIARGAKTSAEVVTVTLQEGNHRGQGECVPYPRYGESPESVTERIEKVVDRVASGMNTEALQSVMPPGAARNAVDCALWDLEAKRSGRPVWQLLDMPRPAPLVTAYTLSLDTPESMSAAAAQNAGRPLLKIKLGGDGDVGRIRAVRDGAPQAALVVDANEAWSRRDYDALVPVFAELGVSMIEQPAPAGDDGWLADVERPIPICADESCHDTATLGALVGKYDMINIKLDKTGGLTEALRLRSAARDAGLDIMVGCMVGTSLAMAPAFLVAQGASVVDLDGPLLLKEDRNPGIRYDGSRMVAVPAALWG